MYLHLKSQHLFTVFIEWSIAGRIVYICAMTPLQKYAVFRDDSARRIKLLKTRLAKFSVFRISIFLLTGLGVYYFWSSTLLSAVIFLLGAGLFLFFVRKHADKKESLQLEKHYFDLTVEAIALLSGHWRGRGKGMDLGIPGHPYASDLNIFGEHSLFQFINRCETPTARQILAEWLQTNLTDIDRVVEERRIIAHLAEDPDWTLKFLAQARTIKESKEELNSADKWKDEKEFDRKPVFWFLTTWLLPAAMLGSLGLYIADVISGNVLIYILLLPAVVLMSSLKKHQERFARFLRLLQDVTANEGMLNLIRERDFSETPFKQKLASAHFDESQEGIRQLRKVVGSIESRNNVVVAIALNLFLAWDFQCARQLTRWKKIYGGQVADWLHLLRHTEAYLSLATYCHNHPDHIYPEMIRDDDFFIDQGRHPLMHAGAVPNDLDLCARSRFVIITGANMAGKSTYLRMVGLNLVLAMRGLPVQAAAMRFRPVQLYTSMLASDSLGENESYFFSELKRLRQMTDALETGAPHFVILDEILKGTNSVDKAEGSKRFLRKLLSLPAKGLIATHDLTLCAVKNSYPDEILNQRFEVEFSAGELHFDYTLRDGVCENMNASFLLEQMGLVLKDTPG